MKKLTKKERGEWSRKIAQLIEAEAESSQHLYDFLIKCGDVEKAQRHESPTKKQRDQWAQLFERYAASGDSEQAMVIDIVAYLSGKLAGKHRAGISLIDQVTSMGRKPRESGSKGGNKTKFEEVHVLALKTYDEDPEQSFQSVAEFVAEIANKSLQEFGLTEGDEVRVRTVRDRLSDAVKRRKKEQQR